MGRKSRNLRKAQKLQARHKKKALKQTAYAAAQAEQKKRKYDDKAFKPTLERHPRGNCGNVGCALCSPGHSPEAYERAWNRAHAISNSK